MSWFFLPHYYACKTHNHLFYFCASLSLLAPVTLLPLSTLFCHFGVLFFLPILSHIRGPPSPGACRSPFSTHSLVSLWSAFLAHSLTFVGLPLQAPHSLPQHSLVSLWSTSLAHSLTFVGRRLSLSSSPWHSLSHDLPPRGLSYPATILT